MSVLELVLAHLNSNLEKILCVMNAFFAVITSLCLFGCAVSEQKKGLRSDISSGARCRQEMGCLHQEHSSALGLEILLPRLH